MDKKLKKRIIPWSGILLILLVSCATVPVQSPDATHAAYTVADEGTLLTRYAPVFVIENDPQAYNRIGTPSAKIGADGKETIFVDPGQATLYTRVDRFETARDTYTNLVYRIHFEKVPGGFAPYHLGKGRNVGLIVIVTLDSGNRPLMYTSVHTCGCYLAFVPTSHMPAEVFPDAWQKGRQSVYSEDLPGILEFGGSFPDGDRAVILIREATHRVKDIWLSDTGSLKEYRNVRAQLQPLIALENLPIEDRGTTTSFYETAGARKDYVKGSYKIRERLLMSWWAFDWRVGEDKRLGKDEHDGILFYTSLKPWDRKKSDLRNFVRFSSYWGWKL